MQQDLYRDLLAQTGIEAAQLSYVDIGPHCQSSWRHGRLAPIHHFGIYVAEKSDVFRAARVDDGRKIMINNSDIAVSTLPCFIQTPQLTRECSRAAT
ncbi:uncharacterized protein CCOS01_13276 [Colletotrichum costaricense]|uniref:Uncharacterized protein n=1 Tax=Colletotrichum costaricense TaxID=1209916 RepID=A0AAI9YL66_9PEZI|nr:uncharacterized protein CCOS01_13276 [Colletotrichum costaricense]KAK1515083.1 hypothetical protein CCOS01_13276 [Colletotrichum costaricense]